MILDFSHEKGPMFFEFVYEGFILGGSLTTQKGISVLRRELDLMGRFEAISHEFPCGKKIVADEPKRKLNKEGSLVVHVGLPEYDLLWNYITAVPWSTGVSLKRAMETIDWLEQCQRSTVS